jgi:glutaminyl-peptide cyclotransferase
MTRSLCLLVILAAGAGALILFFSNWLSVTPVQGGRYQGGLQDDVPFAADNAGDPAEETEAQERVRTPFAADRLPERGPNAIELNGKRALQYLQDICAIGPRMSGTAGMRKQQELLRKHFTKLGGKITMQEFDGKQKSRKEPVAMANMIVSWQPEKRRRVIISSHYDTRPIADQERDPRKWRDTFVSANDGGSGVAFLMELAHHMDDLKTAVGVDFVFFDGEEYVFEPRRDEYFFGSKHFAKTWRANPRRPEYGAAVLLDMIAGKRPHFPAEGYSYMRAQPLVLQIWKIAKDQGCDAFQARVGQHVQDDHLALLNVGIPAIDIIDFDYPHWHRLSDVPENCAEEGLLQVGRVLTVWLQRLQ